MGFKILSIMYVGMNNSKRSVMSKGKVIVIGME